MKLRPDLSCSLVWLQSPVPFPPWFKAGNTPSLQGSYQIQQGEPTFFSFLFASRPHDEPPNLWKGPDPVVGRELGWRDSSCCFLGNTRGFAVGRKLLPPLPPPQNNVLWPWWLQSNFAFFFLCFVFLPLDEHFMTELFLAGCWLLERQIQEECCWGLCKENIINVTMMGVPF